MSVFLCKFYLQRKVNEPFGFYVRTSRPCGLVHVAEDPQSPKQCGYLIPLLLEAFILLLAAKGRRKAKSYTIFVAEKLYLRAEHSAACRTGRMGLLPLSWAVRNNTFKDQMCLAASGYPGHFFPCLCVSLEPALGQAVFVELKAGSNSLLCRFLWRKKKHTGCQTWKSIKKGEEESVGGRDGVGKKCDPVILVCSEGESLTLPPPPSVELLGWVLSSQACKARLKSTCLYPRCAFSRVVSDPKATAMVSQDQLGCSVLWEADEGSPMVDHRELCAVLCQASGWAARLEGSGARVSCV